MASATASSLKPSITISSTQLTPSGTSDSLVTARRVGILKTDKQLQGTRHLRRTFGRGQGLGEGTGWLEVVDRPDETGQVGRDCSPGRGALATQGLIRVHMLVA